MPAFFNSMAAKLAIIVAIFFAVPLFLYWQFKAGDDERRSLLLKLVEEQGALVARTLYPIIEADTSGQAIPEVNTALSRLNMEDLRIKLLFRPKGESGSDSFYYVATSPSVPTDYIDKERAELINTGVLEKMRDTCDGKKSLAIRYINPAGEAEILTSITPITAGSGCWVVITSRSVGDLLGSSITKPYWQSGEIQAAAAVYVLMAVLILTLFAGIWRGLGRFTKAAREIRIKASDAPSFASLNSMPELGSVAEEFDRLVGTLRHSAQSIRDAAEENAHAFKTPLSIIRQSLEPLKRSVRGGDARSRRALENLESSVDRLDTLVSAARRLEESTADLINPPRDLINLSELLDELADEYKGAAIVNDVLVAARVQEGVYVRGGTELLETVIENILDNAIGFSPHGGLVQISAVKTKGVVRIAVTDDGPGMPSDMAEKVFERYFSYRKKNANGSGAGNGHDGTTPEAHAHYGIGLWVVRRNIEALGGRVSAHNRHEGGFAIRIELPLAAH